MKWNRLVVVVLLASGLSSASSSLAATTGTSAITLAASATAVLEVLDAALVLNPNAADYTNDYVEVAGGSGLRVRLKCNSTTGCVLNIKCADASPQIALADFRFRTQTAAGAGGSTIAAYTSITAANQALWSTGAPQTGWLTVTTDIRVQNLMAYPDAIGAGSTTYTDNLTYTVVAQ